MPFNYAAGEVSQSRLDSKEINQVNLQGNKTSILVGRTDAEIETFVFWSSDANS